MEPPSPHLASSIQLGAATTPPRPLPRTWGRPPPPRFARQPPPPLCLPPRRAWPAAASSVRPTAASPPPPQAGWPSPTAACLHHLDACFIKRNFSHLFIQFIHMASVCLRWLTFNNGQDVYNTFIVSLYHLRHSFSSTALIYVTLLYG